MKVSRAGVLSAAVAMLTACVGVVEPTDAPPPTPITRDVIAQFQTDSLRYTLQAGSIGYEMSLVIMYTNKSPRTTSFANCGGATDVRLEKLVDDQWQWAWAPALALCASPPIVVPPGGTHTFRIHVFGGYPDCRCAPRFVIADIPGVYRAVWRGGFGAEQDSNGANGEPALPLTGRISNRFVLGTPSP